MGIEQHSPQGPAVLHQLLQLIPPLPAHEGQGCDSAGTLLTDHLQMPVEIVSPSVLQLLHRRDFRLREQHLQIGPASIFGPRMQGGVIPAQLPKAVALGEILRTEVMATGIRIIRQAFEAADTIGRHQKQQTMPIAGWPTPWRQHCEH